MPCDITILTVGVVCCELQRDVFVPSGKVQGGSRGGGIPPVFTEMWPKVDGGAAEVVQGGCGGEVRLGVVGHKAACGHAKPCGASSEGGRAKRC